MSATAKTNTNNPSCSCSGHTIPQHGIIKHVVACCEIPHYEGTAVRIQYKGTVYAFFDDQRAADPTVLVENILDAGKVMFPQISRKEMVNLLIDYLEITPRITPR